MVSNQSNQSNQIDPVLSGGDVAILLGRSKKTIWRWWRKDKIFPAPIQINGRCIGWRRSTIDNFLDQKMVEVAR